MLLPWAAEAAEGIVRGPEGMGQPGLQVTVFTGEEFTEEAADEQVMTGAGGQFRLAGDYPDGAVLEIHGDDGAGRVRWKREEDEGPLELDYPVLESIILLHDNDQHFDFNSPKAFQARVEGYRREYDNVFLLNAGDVFTRHPQRWEENGTSYADDTSWYRQRALGIIELMNRIGYDAMTVGNHELAHIENHTRDALSLARFPLLGANVELATDKLPPLTSHITLKTDTGRRIGVLGLSTGSGEGVRVRKPLEVVPQYLRLRDEHDVLVALTHIGYAADRQLAREFPQFDLIIGGHSHTLLEQALLENDVLVAQAGGNPHEVSRKHPKYLGVITLTLENGTLKKKRGDVFALPLPEEAAVP